MKSGRRPTKRASGKNERPSREAAENAVRTLIQWAGDDPDREGLRGTPARVVRAYEEWFAGYFEDPSEYLHRTFEESPATTRWCCCAISGSNPIASITSHRSSAAFTSATFRAGVSSGFPSS